MESQPQNLEFRIYPENFHPCHYGINANTALSTALAENTIRPYFS